MEVREREIAELEALQQKPLKTQATQPEAKAPAAVQPTQQPQTTKETPQDFYGVDTSFQDDGIDPSVAQVAAEGVLSPL